MAVVKYSRELAGHQRESGKRAARPHPRAFLCASALSCLKYTGIKASVMILSRLVGALLGYNYEKREASLF